MCFNPPPVGSHKTWGLGAAPLLPASAGPVPRDSAPAAGSAKADGRCPGKSPSGSAGTRCPGRTHRTCLWSRRCGIPPAGGPRCRHRPGGESRPRARPQDMANAVPRWLHVPQGTAPAGAARVRARWGGKENHSRVTNAAGGRPPPPACWPREASACEAMGIKGPSGGPHPPPAGQRKPAHAWLWAHGPQRLSELPARGPLCRGCWREPRTEPQAQTGRVRAHNGLGPQSSDPAQSNPGPTQELCGTHRLPRPHNQQGTCLVEVGQPSGPPSEPLPHNSLLPRASVEWLKIPLGCIPVPPTEG